MASKKQQAPITVWSFGYGHASAPPTHLTIDVREHFRDPHVSPELRHQNGRDQAVITAVTQTPGVTDLIEAIAAAVRAFLTAPQPGPLAVAVGCQGGRHRSVVIADAVASKLGQENVLVEVLHRDIGRLVIEHPGSGAE